MLSAERRYQRFWSFFLGRMALEWESTGAADLFSAVQYSAVRMSPHCIRVLEDRGSSVEVLWSWHSMESVNREVFGKQFDQF